MVLRVADFRRHPNPLARHYRRFRVAERVLLTGHSHQAWPDCAYEGQKQAWLDAAEWVDAKWERAEEKAWAVRRGYARLLDDRPENIALGANTHELVVRFLSGLPLRDKPRLVTTDGEFHSIRRQLDRLEEEGLEVVRIPAIPPDAVAERLCAAIHDRTAAVLVSKVMFRTAHRIPGLDHVMGTCRRFGAELLVDVYHVLNVLPFSISAEGLEDAWILGGGYKYCQLGEGNAFLRFPPDTAMRPVVTGWFAEFDGLLQTGSDKRVMYSTGPVRFAGATYDPTSHYRAAVVFDFFQRQQLSPTLLRAINRHQIQKLIERFDSFDVPSAVIGRDRTVSLEAMGGFLPLRTPYAGVIHRALLKQNVRTDYRGNILRLGPAPYLSDAQLDTAMDALEEVLKGILAKKSK